MCRHKDILTQIVWFDIQTRFMSLRLTDEQLGVINDMATDFNGSLEEAIAAACREYLDNRTCKAKEVA